jgi:hypothetical protein
MAAFAAKTMAAAPNVKALHRNSTFSKSSSLIDVAICFDGRPRGLWCADLRAFAVRSSSSWMRFRRAIFCLRSRLNLDLSPFRADMMNS